MVQQNIFETEAGVSFGFGCLQAWKFMLVLLWFDVMGWLNQFYTIRADFDNEQPH